MGLYEVALWEDILTAQGEELFYAYMVDNQAIVIPETINAIRRFPVPSAIGSPQSPRPILRWA